ncbi:HDIG domain-containing metalloprotein [Candidatus Poriferisodalis sp.]|uniref:HDIG domain-containing metalloprotein n=1 Tax=Candidatus Poriferisodalis sp. TaxID=3101277 RepID=UPI003B0180E3
MTAQQSATRAPARADFDAQHDISDGSDPDGDLDETMADELDFDLGTVLPCDELNSVLVADDPRAGLWELVDSGWAHEHLPELPALALAQDPIHRHKDVLAHTIAVVTQSPPRLRVRLGALFHDIGKPLTRSFEHGGVTFRNHEAVGARLTRKRMPKMGYGTELTEEVARLVHLSGRFKGYDTGWTDAAVRRYARDAGPLLGDLNDMVRSDCTSRNVKRIEALHDALDRFEVRLARLAREQAAKQLRPELNGDEVMAQLGLRPGPEVGRAMKFLLELRRIEGELGTVEARRRLDAWWANTGAADDAREDA